ncbi:MAG: alpha/beta hydrolase [Candidatus Binataceae bacterium]
MGDESKPAAAEPSRAGRTPRRLFYVGSIMFAVAAALWFGAATVVSRRLKYPEFPAGGRGDVHGVHVPKLAADADPHNAFGADFKTVKIDGAGGGDSAAGWFIPASDSSTAVLLLPPSGASRAAMLPYAKFLHAANFAVLTIDSGDTPGAATDWGVRESGRALSAADWLKGRGFKTVAALGVSEGAAAALFAQAKRPVFAAIVADSSYDNLGAMLRRTPSVAGLNSAFVATVMYAAALRLGGDPVFVSPAKAAARLGGARVMIIQNRGDELTPRSDGLALLAMSGSATRMWNAPSNGHGDAIFAAPDQYAARVTMFLNQALTGKSPAQ